MSDPQIETPLPTDVDDGGGEFHVTEDDRFAELADTLSELVEIVSTYEDLVPLAVRDALARVNAAGQPRRLSRLLCDTVGTHSVGGLLAHTLQLRRRITALQGQILHWTRCPDCDRLVSVADVTCRLTCSCGNHIDLQSEADTVDPAAAYAELMQTERRLLSQHYDLSCENATNARRAAILHDTESSVAELAICLRGSADVLALAASGPATADELAEAAVQARSILDRVECADGLVWRLTLLQKLSEAIGQDFSRRELKTLATARPRVGDALRQLGLVVR